MKTLDDGRTFPTHGDEVLCWDLGAYFTSRDESEGYPRTLAVMRAMRAHRPEQFAREYRPLLLSTSDRLFGHNAKRLLSLYEKVRDE